MNIHIRGTMKNIGNRTVNPGTAGEVRCIHTVLGQEFDYNSIIVGNDFIYRNGEVVPDSNQNTQFMAYIDNDKQQWYADRKDSAAGSLKDQR